MKFVMKKTLAFTLAILLNAIALAQNNEVKMMQSSSGVARLDCKVNGIPMWFVFDSGASICQISLTEALFLLKSGKLSLSDRLEDVEMRIADGSSYVGYKFNIKELTIGTFNYSNVEFVVVPDNYAPILLGQNVLKKHDGILIDYVNDVVTFYPKTTINSDKKNLKDISDNNIKDGSTKRLIRERDSLQFEIKNLNRELAIKDGEIKNLKSKVQSKETEFTQLMGRYSGLSSVVGSKSYTTLPSGFFRLKMSWLKSGNNYKGSIYILPTYYSSSIVTPSGPYKISKLKFSGYNLIYFPTSGTVGYTRM